MRLDKIDDPRTPLQKLTKKELEYLARKERRTDIEPGMPADLMREMFKERPPSAWPRPMKSTLGSLQQLRIPPYAEWEVIAFRTGDAKPAEPVEVNALADLRRQWEEQKAAPPEPEKKMTMGEMRAECKRRGIKMVRTDNMTTLKAKLDGEDTSQLRQ